jgi:hypothetical protein
MRDEDEAAKMDSYRQTPLFQKAQEILGTTRRVVEFMNDEAAENGIYLGPVFVNCSIRPIQNVVEPK